MPQPTQSFHKVEKPVYCTEHLANFIVRNNSVRDSQGRLISKLDWAKIPKILSGEWPKAHPNYLVNDFSLPYEGLEYIVIDNEWYYGGVEQDGIYQTGLYHPSIGPYIFDLELCRDTEEIASVIKGIISEVPVVFQNASADIPRMEKAYGLGYGNYFKVHDTLYLHSCYMSELPHNLAFMGSCHSDYTKLKHLGPGSYEYLVGDLVDTDCVWREINKEIDSDSKHVYQTLMVPLIPIIMDAEKRGIKVNENLVRRKGALLEKNIHFARELASSYCGYEINLNSPKQMIHALTIEEDVFAATRISKRMTKKGNLSLNLDKIDELRYQYLAKEEGVEETPEYIQSRLNRGGHPLLEAKALYAGSAKLYSSYIKPLMEGEDNV